MLRAVPNPRGRHDISAALGRLRRRGARRRDLRMGQGGARRRDQRILRPDRMQPGGRLLRRDRRGAAGRDRQGDPRPHRRGDRRARAIRSSRARLGQIAVQRPDPVMFLEYWGQPEATREKFIGDWMTTGDQGVIDEDGYFTFVGRDDDVITSAGYRIGPGEIEDCLIKHPAVALAAVVGKPDPVRTEIVKAFIVLKAGARAVRRARRRHPGLRAHAAVRARISARDRLHRRDADDHHRQGDPAAAAGEGVTRSRKARLSLFLLLIFAENRVPVVLVGLSHRLLALAPAVVRWAPRPLSRRPRPWLALHPPPWPALHLRPWTVLHLQPWLALLLPPWPAQRRP